MTGRGFGDTGVLISAFDPADPVKRQADCRLFVSEDLQDGREVAGLRGW